MAAKVALTPVMKQTAENTAQAMLNNLAKNADSIAVQLYREKVRKARCSSATKCALAQYIANKMPKGVGVSVGEDVILFDTTKRFGEEFARFSTTDAQDEFITNFDEKQYAFLTA